MDCALSAGAGLTGAAELEFFCGSAARWRNAAISCWLASSLPLRSAFSFSAWASAASAFAARSVSAVLFGCCAAVVPPPDAFTVAATGARGGTMLARSAFIFWPFIRAKSVANNRKTTASPLKLLGVTVKNGDSRCAISVPFNNESREKAITICAVHRKVCGLMVCCSSKPRR